jgi:hypothetical protein
LIHIIEESSEEDETDDEETLTNEIEQVLTMDDDIAI